MQLHAQKSGIYFLKSKTTPAQIKSRIQETVAEKIKRNMPVIYTSESSIVKVIIHNEEEYRAFVYCLGEYNDYRTLILDLDETDTVIYLDEILAYHNFANLKIAYGGIISARNIEKLNANSLKDIDLFHIYAIEENMLSQMFDLQYITICLNSWYMGVLPTKELLHDTDCSDIVMICDDRKDKVNPEEFVEWDEINIMLSGNSCYIKGLYVWNDDDYDYISYEFGGEEAGQACEAYICIKDRESHGEKYFDILEVPVEDDHIWGVDRHRITLCDMNFDGYRDILVRGIDFAIGGYQCIAGFLWNETEQKYELNTTVPKVISWIDVERQRITCVYTSSLEDEYRIYEYNGSVFTEKSLVVSWSLEVPYRVTWKYYEGGELLKRLEKNYNKETKLYYITYEENGIVTEEIMEEVDYDNKYGSYSDLGEEYFPEFDFYAAG